MKIDLTILIEPPSGGTLVVPEGVGELRRERTGGLLTPGFWSHRGADDYAIREKHIEVLSGCALQNRQWTLILEEGVLLDQEGGWRERLEAAVGALPGESQGLFLGPNLQSQPWMETPLLNGCRGMFSPWGYVVGKRGAWRLHEHLKFWPRATIWEAMLDVTRMEGGFWFVRPPLVRAPPEGCVRAWGG